MRASRILSLYRTMRSAMRFPSVLVLASGILILLAFYLPFGWPLIFIALVPLCYAIRHSKNARHAFLLGMLVGAFIVGGTTSWFFAALPFPAFEHRPLVSFLAVFVSWSIALLAMSPLTGVWAAAVKYARIDTVIGGAFAVVAWGICEYARMYLFTLVTLAPGINNPPFFSAGFLGYPLADNASWLQLASFGGVYLMSAVVVAINLLFFAVIVRSRRQTQRKLMFLAAIILLVSVIPLASVRASLDQRAVTPLRVGVVSLYLPKEAHTAGFKFSPSFRKEVDEAMGSFSSMSLDVILLSEGARYLNAGASFTPASSSPVIIDSWVATTSVPVAVGYAGSLDKSVQSAIRAKRVLTPQGEYVINIFRLISSWFGKDAAHIANSFGFATGSWGNALSIPQAHLRASVMFCVEMLMPGLGASLVREEGSDVLFFMLSQGDFRDSFLLYTDTFRYLRVRTVEAGVPSVVSGDYATAYAFDAYGNLLMALDGRTGVMYGVATVPVPSR
jgi:apolipoprotein N-acyltransferase